MKMVFFFCTKFNDPCKGDVWFRTKGTYHPSKGEWTLYFFGKSGHNSCVHGCEVHQCAPFRLQESLKGALTEERDVEVVSKL